MLNEQRLNLLEFVHTTVQTDMKEGGNAHRAGNRDVSAAR